MAFLYSKSQTWRRIVNWTRESGGRLMMFGAVCVAVPVYLGSLVMDQTSGAGRNARLESELMDKANLDAKIGAKAQKNALAEMLRDVKEGKVDDRYNAAIVDGTIGSPRKSGLLVGKKAQEDAKKVSS